MFKVGDRVRCIRGASEDAPQHPIEGENYIVSGVKGGFLTIRRPDGTETGGWLENRFELDRGEPRFRLVRPLTSWFGPKFHTKEDAISAAKKLVEEMDEDLLVVELVASVTSTKSVQVTDLT